LTLPNFRFSFVGACELLIKIRDPILNVRGVRDHVIKKLIAVDLAWALGPESSEAGEHCQNAQVFEPGIRVQFCRDFAKAEMIEYLSEHSAHRRYCSVPVFDLVRVISGSRSSNCAHKCTGSLDGIFEGDDCKFQSVRPSLGAFSFLVDIAFPQRSVLSVDLPLNYERHDAGREIASETNPVGWVFALIDRDFEWDYPKGDQKKRSGHPREESRNHKGRRRNYRFHVSRMPCLAEFVERCRIFDFGVAATADCGVSQ
jgi:hypothetical protein